MFASYTSAHLTLTMSCRKGLSTLFAVFLLQDLAQGKSLAELVKGGWRADEEEVTRIAKELLNILDYLATRRPAVTHRFVPPSLSCYH